MKTIYALILGTMLSFPVVACADDPQFSNHQNLQPKTGEMFIVESEQRGSVLTVGLNIGGMQSRDAIGDFFNNQRIFQLGTLFGPPGTRAEIIGIGWTTNQTAFNPSWISEMRLLLNDHVTSPPPGLHLQPGTTNAPGTGFFNVPVATLIPSLVLSSGVLHIEAYESIDSLPGADGVYNGGSTIFVRVQQRVPAPGCAVAMAMFAVFHRRRRRSVNV